MKNLIDNTDQYSIAMQCLPFCADQGGAPWGRACLVINWEENTIDITTRPHFENGCPSRTWHNLDWESNWLPFGINAILLHDLINENMEALDAIREGFESHHDGSNFVGRFTEDAEDLLHTFTGTLEELTYNEFYQLSLWDASEYFESACTRGNFCVNSNFHTLSINDDLEKTLLTTLTEWADDEIESKVVEVESYAAELADWLRTYGSCNNCKEWVNRDELTDTICADCHDSYDVPAEAADNTIQILAEDLYAVGIHGTTGQAIDTGTLPAGTQIRHLTQGDTEVGPVWRFEARDAPMWFTHECYEEPKIARHETTEQATPKDPAADEKSTAAADSHCGRCDICGARVSPAERDLGWPLTSLEETCPSCYGDGAFCCNCEEVLPAGGGTHSCVNPPPTERRVIVKRLLLQSGAGECYVINGATVDTDGAQDVQLDAGPVGLGAWWGVPLPPCPDCGGALVWCEAGYAPGTRRCGCGSMFEATTWSAS